MKLSKKTFLIFVGLFALALTVSVAQVCDVSMSDGVVCLAVMGPLLYQQGKNNMGGYSNWAAVIPLDYISSAPALPAAPADWADYVTAAGKFIFNNIGETENKYAPIFIYSTEAKVSYSADSVGEVDGKSYEQKGEFFYPGNESEIAGFAAFIKNRPCIVIIADPDGKQQMVGTPSLPCHISPSKTGGQARADLRGSKFEFSAPSNQSDVYLEDQFTVDPVAGTLAYPS